MLQVGIIGTGYGEAHLKAFAAIPDVKIVGVCAATLESARAAAARYDVPFAATSYEELLVLDHLEAISIVTPTYLHRDIALQAISRDLHVLCEKPLAVDAREGREMLQAAEAAGVVHATNYDYRNLPNFQKLHRLLETGHIGEVKHCTIHWMSEYNADRTIHWNWRHSKTMAGVGTLGDMSHVIDDIFWHFGDIAKVFGHLATVTPNRPDSTGKLHPNTAEDAAAFVAVSRTGVQICVHLSRCAPGGGYRFIEIFGSEGMLRATMPLDSYRWNTTLVCARLDDRTPSDLSEQTDPSSVEKTQDRFVDAIRDRSKPVYSSFRDGLDVLRLTDALQRSHEEGCWMNLEPR